MDAKQAIEILKNYREVDEETGEVYCTGMIVLGSLGDNYFRCWAKGPGEEELTEVPSYAAEEINTYFVTEEGDVLPIPT